MKQFPQSSGRFSSTSQVIKKKLINIISRKVVTSAILFSIISCISFSEVHSENILSASAISSTSIFQMNDTTSSFGLSTHSGRQIQSEFVSPTSSLVGKSIDNIAVKLQRAGAPTGTVQVGVFNSDLSVKQLFGTIDASSVAASPYTQYSFSLPIPQSYQIQSGDRIGIKFVGGDASNYIAIMTDQNNTFDGINSYLTFYTTSWQSTTGADLSMILRSSDNFSGPTVSASPPAGTYDGSQLVTLTASVPSTIYYTTNGSTPTTSSTSAPSPVSLNVITNSTLKYFAKDLSNTTGPISSASYIILPLSSTSKTIALLQFEQNVLDATSNHNNGIVTGNAKYTSGKIGSYAFNFDGQTHITLANPSQFAFEKTNPFSISFWIKMAPNNIIDMYLLSNSNDQNSAGISIWKSHLSNSLTFKIQNGYGKSFEVSGTTNLSDNEWHLVLFTYDGLGNQRGMKVYADGALQAVGVPSTIAGTIITNKAETIGSTVSSSMPFTGTLDNVQILNYLMPPNSLQRFFGLPSLFPPILSTPIPTKTGVSLSWTPVIGAIGYNIYRDGKITNTALESSASYFDSGLGSSTTHSYQVIAVNGTSGTSPPSKVYSITTTTSSLNPKLKVGIFTTNISTDTSNLLKANFQAGDGIIAGRLPYIQNIQDDLKISGLEHFVLATRLGEIDPSCSLGPVPSFSDLVSQSLQANQSGYRIKSIIYDIEGWCWTPQSEINNYVSSIDNAANLAHASGFKSGIVPTHAELLQWYPSIHWTNIDYLYIQFHKSIMTKESNYTLFDPKYTTDVTQIINFVRAQNPNIKIFLCISPNWEPVGSMIYVLNQFKNQIQGVDLYDLPPYDPNTIGSPFPNENTVEHQKQIIKAINSI